MGRYWFSQNFFFSINAKLAADLLYQSINSISDKNGNPDQRGPIYPVKLLYYRLAGALSLCFLLGRWHRRPPELHLAQGTLLLLED